MNNVHRREARRRASFAERARDLEVRAVEALAGGREDLAARAVEAIATIETEVEASEAASVRFAAKVSTTRREVDAERRRLAELERGGRLAKVGAAIEHAAPQTMENDTQTVEHPSNTWIVFGYISVAMVGGGILLLPLDWWVKVYFAMGAVMLMQSCFSLAKNLRDVHEAGRFINRLETARTERLLREA